MKTGFVQAVTGSSSGLKISLAALDDGVGVDPGAGPELDPDPEVTPELSDPAGDRFGVDLFKCYQTFFLCHCLCNTIS